MAMTYTSYVTTMQTMLVVADPSGVDNLNAILPNMIEYAELRMYRDLQLLNTVVGVTGTLSANTRDFTIPAPAGGTFVVMQSMQVFTPVSSTVSTGKANPLERVSKEALLAMCPDPAQTDVPQVYADVDNSTVLLGPVPDAAYAAQIYGTYRPSPLSASNTTTLLTNLFGDIFVAASMIFGAGYQRDFGAQTDDPGLGASWESQYKSLMSGATVEEFMKKAEAPGWQPFEPAPVATPPRQ